MVASSDSPSRLETGADDYGDAYYRNYHGASEPYDWNTPAWRDFFTGAAERIRSITNPGRVLDVGCAHGFLVHAFVLNGVDAYGIDISEHAVESAQPEVRDRLSVMSAEKLTGEWDLITCIEVLEHMSSADVEATIDAMCAATDRILISSTPGDFDEPTHINVREPAAWAASLAERGFFRRTDVDLSFLTPWAVLFQRDDPNRRDVVYRYERYSYPLRVEVLEKRAALLAASRKLAEIEVPDRAAELAAIDDLRHRLLTSRDHAIGAEAEAATWREKFRTAEQELLHARHDLAVASNALDNLDKHVKEIRASTTWRIGSLFVRPLTRLRRGRGTGN